LSLVGLMLSDLLRADQFPFFVLDENMQQMVMEISFLAQEFRVRYIHFINENEIICKAGGLL
jgi:hypothetical protein